MLFFRYCHIATRKRNWMKYQQSKVEPFFVLAVTTSSDCTFIHSRVYRSIYIYIGPSLHSNCIELPHSWEIAGRLPSFFPVDIFKTGQTVVTFFLLAFMSYQRNLFEKVTSLITSSCSNKHLVCKLGMFRPEWCNVFIASKRLKDPYPSWKKHPPLNRGSCRSCRWSRVRR